MVIFLAKKSFIFLVDKSYIFSQKKSSTFIFLVVIFLVVIFLVVIFLVVIILMDKLFALYFSPAHLNRILLGLLNVAIKYFKFSV